MSLGTATDSQTRQTATASVLIVGAGPVGLTLACLLRLQGVDCQIVETDAGPTPRHESRALGIHARTLEVLEDLDVTAQLVQRGLAVRSINAHEQGRRIVRFDLNFEGLRTPYPFVLLLSQGELEELLVERLRSLELDVQWKTRLVELHQDSHSVTATLADESGRARQLRTDWLVGCDGAHSTVRHQLGLSFEGTAYEERFLLADVTLDWKLDHDEAHLLLSADGLLPALPLPQPGRWRLIDATGVSEAQSPPEIAQRFGELLHKSGYSDAEIQQTWWATSFRIHRRTVEHLRVGGCLLAGDAAHIHSPVGGQGLNTGVQDAGNLAWKLALVIHRISDSSLLDSYQRERLPVARRVLRATDRATRVATLRSPLARRVRKMMIPLLLRSTFFRRRMTRALSELGVNYHKSPIVDQDWRGPSRPSAPKPGDRVGDVTLGQQRLYDVLRGVHHTLLLFPGHTMDEQQAKAWRALIHTVRAYNWIRIYQICVTDKDPSLEPDIQRVEDPQQHLHDQFAAQRPCLYLIRPDGYLAYRATPPDADLLHVFLTRITPPAARLSL